MLSDFNLFLMEKSSVSILLNLSISQSLKQLKGWLNDKILISGWIIPLNLPILTDNFKIYPAPPFSTYSPVGFAHYNSTFKKKRDDFTEMNLVRTGQRKAIRLDLLQESSYMKPCGSSLYLFANCLRY